MDIRTLFVAIALSNLAFAMGIFLYLKGQHSVHHSIEIWGRSRFLAGLGIILNGFRGPLLPAPMAILAGNSLIFTAIFLSVVAFKSCLERHMPRLPSVSVVFLLFVGFWLLVLLTGIPENYRLAMFSLYFATAMAIISRDLAKDWRDNSVLQKFLAALTPFLAAATLLRGVDALLNPAASVFSRNTIQVAGMLVGFVETVTTSFGFLLLAKERTDRELEMQAGTDHLTQLPNRRAFYATAEKVFSLEKRNGQPISLLLLDLDHFKGINDRYGHHVGDGVLQGFAGILRSMTRQCDFLVRLGGEEFGVLMPDTPPEAAGDAAERIRLAAEAWEQNGVRCTVSIGICGGEAASDLDHYFRQADAALYRAKAGGRNRVEMEKA